MPISLLDFFFLLLGNNHQKINSAVFPQLSSCFSDPCPRCHSFHSPALPGLMPLGISSAANLSGHSFFASRWSWWFVCSCFSSWFLLPFLFLYVCGTGAQGCLTLTKLQAMLFWVLVYMDQSMGVFSITTFFKVFSGSTAFSVAAPRFPQSSLL